MYESFIMNVAREFHFMIYITWLTKEGYFP